METELFVHGFLKLPPSRSRGKAVVGEGGA